MSQPQITVYVTSWCPYCQRAKSLLAEKNVSFNEIDVDADPKLRTEMLSRGGRRSVPQIFIGNTHVGGCDDLYALDGRGELDRLIQGG